MTAHAKTADPANLPEEDLADLFEIVSEVLEVPRDRLQLDSRFVEDLAADSLDIVELAMALEEHYEVSVPDEATTQLKSIRDVADLLATATRSECES